MSHRLFIIWTLLFAVCLLSQCEVASAATTQHGLPNAKAIDPSALKISNVEADFGAAAPLVRAKYREFVKAYQAGRLDSAKTSIVRTLSGKAVDLKEVFVFVNQVNLALTIDHKKPLTALNAQDSIPATSASSLTRALKSFNLVAERAMPYAAPLVGSANAVPQVGPPPSPAPATPAPTTTPGTTASPCPTSSATPAPFDADTAWTEIQEMAGAKTTAGTPVQRCSLTFVHILESAENGTPLAVAPGPIPIPLPTFFAYGDDKFSAKMTPQFSYQYSADKSALHAQTVITAHSIGFKNDFTLLSVATDLADPSNGKPTFTLSVATAQAPLYCQTFSADQTQPFDIQAIAPTSDVMLFQPIKFHVNDLFSIPIPLDAELDAIGKIGFNGRITASRLGAYVKASPVIEMGVSGSLVASELFLSTRIEGTFYFVKASGDYGFIAVLVPDQTASTYNPTTFGTVTPLIALYRPFGQISYSAGQANISVKASVGGFISKTWSFTISIKGFHGQIAPLDREWTARYVVNASPSPSPSPSVSPTPSASPAITPQSAC